MSHIIEVNLKFEKRLHPNFFVRVFFFFLKYINIKIGFTFNYRAFLNAFDFTGVDLSGMDDMSNTEKVANICYGAALEYCREKKALVFFDKEDIKNALLMASLGTNEDIGKAMSFAKMPDWLQTVMDNMPDAKNEGLKKK